MTELATDKAVSGSSILQQSLDETHSQRWNLHPYSRWFECVGEIGGGSIRRHNKAMSDGQTHTAPLCIIAPRSRPDGSISPILLPTSSRKTYADSSEYEGRFPVRRMRK
jgi:hypothetical protein